MINILLDYMIEHYSQEVKVAKSSTLPFITISRLHGCKGKLIADLLVNKLNSSSIKDKNSPPWHWISKEILESAAKELNVNHARVLQVIRSKWHNSVDEMIASFIDKFYKYDHNVINMINQVISDFASKGHVVIVGRAGLEVTQNIKSGLHISLTAPFEWRVKQIMENEKIKSKKEAGIYANIVDERRLELRRRIFKKPVDDSLFHLTYNSEHFDAETITDSILYHLKLNSSL